MKEPLKRKKGILLDPETMDLRIENGSLVIGEINYPFPPAKFPESIDEAMTEIFGGQIDETNPLTKDFFSKIKAELTQSREDFKDGVAEHNFELSQILIEENKGLEASVLQLAKNNNPTHQSPTSQTKNKTYSLQCNYSGHKIKSDLHPLFDKVFDCTEEQTMNLLSEKITTQIITKNGFSLKDIVYFFCWLYDNNHIKAVQYGDIIGKSKCIVWNGKPITSTQIRKTKSNLTNSFPSIKISNILD